MPEQKGVHFRDKIHKNENKVVNGNELCILLTGNDCNGQCSENNIITHRVLDTADCPHRSPIHLFRQTTDTYVQF